MLKIRNIIIIILINVGLLSTVSLIQEYYSMTTKTNDIKTTVSTSVDTAIQLALASEEFFGDKSSWNSTVSSKNDEFVKVKVFRNGQWIENGVYATSKFYDDYGELPESPKYLTSEQTYEWLYGQINGARVPTKEFKEFYNKIGKNFTSDMYVKAYKDDTSFNIEDKSVPTLCQMGLSLDSNLNRSTQPYAESLANVKKTGKDGSTYYLTPHSLGITYLDTRVLKPIIVAHLEQIMRYKWGKTADSWVKADGCIPTTIYETGEKDAIKHSVGSDEKIINDGIFEIDENSIKVGVEYKIVDFYDKVNYKLVNYIEGSTPDSTDFKQKPSLLQSEDTSRNKDGKRMVARVTVSMNLHIPYSASVLQWLRKENSNGNEDHFDVRALDVNKELTSDKTGVVYTYTTYTAISR